MLDSLFSKYDFSEEDEADFREYTKDINTDEMTEKEIKDLYADYPIEPESEEPPAVSPS